MTKEKGKAGRENNLSYYLKSVTRSMLLPPSVRKMQRTLLLRDWKKRPDADYIRKRVDFYCDIPEGSDVGKDAVCVDDIKIGNTHSRYWFDLMQYLRGFPKGLRINLIDGDVYHNTEAPTIMKARRLTEPGLKRNCALMKLNYRRHFISLSDPVPFEKKIPKLFFRGVISDKSNRVRFMEMWSDNPLCDLGDTSKKNITRWHVPEVSVAHHFNYQFILAIEGNDLATATQWILESNCVPVMTRPTAEGWLMHSLLIPGVHYIEIADDFSDVEEKLKYYISHPEEAKGISEAGKEWAAQFADKKRERIINYLVLEKYFRNTGQL